MSSMTHTALSDCSYPESDNEDIKSQIKNVFERLKAVIQEQDNLRQSLKKLFDKQEFDALEELKRAERSLEVIREERKRMELQVSSESVSVPSIPVSRLHVESPQDILDPMTDPTIVDSPAATHLSLVTNAIHEEEERKLSKDHQLVRGLSAQIADLEHERKCLVEDEEKYKREESYWKMIDVDICQCEGTCPCAHHYNPYTGQPLCDCTIFCQCGFHTCNDTQKDARMAAGTRLHSLSDSLKKTQSRLRFIGGEQEICNKLLAHLATKMEGVQPTESIFLEESVLSDGMTVVKGTTKSKSKNKGKAA